MDRAGPRDKNRDDPCEAMILFSTFSIVCRLWLAEAASRLGPKASFIASLPAGDSASSFGAAWRTARWRGRHGSPMGHNAGPGNSPDHISSAFAGRRRWFTPSGPHSIGLCWRLGPIMHALQDRKAVRHCGRPRCFVMRPAVTPRWGRTANWALRRTPFWGAV
ncbi:hypothetical protein TcYC6_0001270 [Trypanosoma cruzi]|nr:hypothetical protein TcYC6_0001270 [Trypanosoma cruzi]